MPDDLAREHHDEPLGQELARRRMFGLDFVDADSVSTVATSLLESDRRVRPKVVITPNVDQLVRRDRGESEVANELHASADVVLPDGQPIVWASRLFGRPLTARLPGSTLVEALWPSLQQGRRRGFVVANSPRVVEALNDEPDAIDGVLAPMLSVDDRGSLDRFAAECTTRAADHGADLVFVTLGYPKQDIVISSMISQWPPEARPPIFLAVGASFDMLYGFKRRAPKWMQKIGMEWFFRFMLEPARLFRRYFVDDPAFLKLVFREWRRGS